MAWGKQPQQWPCLQLASWGLTVQYEAGPVSSACAAMIHDLCLAVLMPRDVGFISGHRTGENRLGLGRGWGTMPGAAAGWHRAARAR